MPGDLPELNTLWIGGELNFIHRLCLSSAVFQGHSMRLFCYDKVRDVPEGVEVVSAEEILPKSSLFRHRVTQSVAPFADRFRVKLIGMGLGAWIDTDVLLVKPLDFGSSNVFAWESAELIGNAVLNLDRVSPLFKRMEQLIFEDYLCPPWLPWHKRMYLSVRRLIGRPMHVSELTYGTTGPELLTWAVNSSGSLDLVLPVESFYSLPYSKRFEVFKANGNWLDLSSLPAQAVAVHLWYQGLLGGPGKRGQAALPVIEPGSFIDDFARRIGFS